MAGRHNVKLGIAVDAESTAIAKPFARPHGSARREVGGEEGMQARRRVVRHRAQANAAEPEVLHLDGAEDQHLAVAAPSVAGHGSVLAVARDFGFVDLDDGRERGPVGRDHAVAELGAQQPGRLVGAEAELMLELQGRDAVGLGG